MFVRSNGIVLITFSVVSLYILSVAGVCSESGALNLAIVYSGNEQGMLRAHGCGEQQVGGLDHRCTLIKSLYEKHENVLNLHTGGIIDPNHPESEATYQVALEALSIMDCDAVCIGPQELSLPIDSLKALHANHPEIAFTCANLDIADQNVSLFTSYVTKTFSSGSVRSVNVAVVGLASKTYEIEVAAYNPGLTVTSPGEALANLTDALKQESDLVVAVFHGLHDEARELAKGFPWVDAFILTGNERAEDLQNPVNEPIVVGETIIHTCAPKGESVGVLNVGFDRDTRVVSRSNRFIQVSDQIAPSEDISTLLAFYDDLVEDDGLDSGASVPDDQAIHIAYFYKRGCEKCEKANQILRKLKERHPEVVIEKRNVKENQELLEAMGQLHKVPEVKRLTTPAVFIGETYFLDNVDEDQLETVIQRYLPTGVASRLSQAELKTEDAGARIISRFRSLRVLTIAGAGLIDGINPCAFATIVLFISYMSLAGRRRREMLMTGIAFTSAVFVTYFLLGMGALRFLEYLNSFSIIAKIVYLIAAMATFAIAILSFYDAYKAKLGKAREIKLQLPKSLKSRIHKIIRKQTKTSSVVAGALVIGFAIAALELVCTGQVYLPTITFVAGVAGMRIHALSYLLLYNLMFIVPLLIIFGFVYLGATFVQLGGVLQRHLMKVKLGTGVLLLGLAIWLILGVA